MAEHSVEDLARCLEVVAMDGFSGFKPATAQELPDASEVMDPFHAVKFTGDAPGQVRRHIVTLRDNRAPLTGQGPVVSSEGDSGH